MMLNIKCVGTHQWLKLIFICFKLVSYFQVQESRIPTILDLEYYKQYDGAVHPSYRLKLNYPLPLSVSYVKLVIQ